MSESTNTPTIDTAKADLKAMREQLRKAQKAAEEAYGKDALRGPQWSVSTAKPGKPLSTVLKSLQPETAKLLEQFGDHFDGRPVPSLDTIIQSGMGRMVALDVARAKREAEKAGNGA